MSSKAEVGLGDVELTVDGIKLVLRPSLGACIALSKNGGLQDAVRRCVNLEFDAIHSVISQGIGRSAKELPEKIYKEGLRNLSGPCISFLTNLANGGKPVEEREDEGEVPLEKA